MNKIFKGKYLSSYDLIKNYNFKNIGKNVFIDENVIIPHPNNVEIGNNVRIDSNCILSSGDKGNIIIKNNVHIAPFNLIYCANNYKIILEDHSGLAAGCKLYGKTSNYDGNYLTNPLYNKEDIELICGDIILNKFCTSGCDTLLFPGSIIPIGTVLGSKSLYTGRNKLKEWSIYAGIPLKFFRERNKICQILANKYT